MDSPTLPNPDPVVKPPLSHEACGQHSYGRHFRPICGLLSWSNGEEVACKFGKLGFPCPIAEKVHGLEATIARVAALLPKWREGVKETSLLADREWRRGDPNGTGCSCDGSWMAMDGLCDELEAALRGEET
jgi:hypothetical protein